MTPETIKLIVTIVVVVLYIIATLGALAMVLCLIDWVATSVRRIINALEGIREAIDDEVYEADDTPTPNPEEE